MATIRGNDGPNTLNGTSGNDTIYGYNGNDILDGKGGRDTLIGGSNDDTYIVDSTTDTIRELSGGGNDTVQSSVSYSLGLGSFLNNLTLTGGSALNATGNEYDNIITGNSANNILNGGDGIDTLTGGKGNDTYIVDSTTDTIKELSGGGTDTVKSSVSYTLAEGSFLNNLTLTGSSAINGTGNGYDNIIRGNAGNNTLRGEGGSDTLYGGGGNDDIAGADIDGTTTIYGDAGDDVLDVTFGSVYGGSGNDVVSGEYGTVDGGDGDDRVSGNNAFLVGGLGRDTISGDFQYSIQYNSSSEGGDTINGFDSGDGTSGGEGLILIDASGFGGGLVAGALSSDQFVLGSSAQDSNDRFIYNSTGNVFFDVDGSGSSGQVQLATLTDNIDLSASDFYIFG